MKPCLISACLLGRPCRWDGGSRPSPKAAGLAQSGFVIPVCPEQLGGLPTPREPAELCLDDKVLTKSGLDVTENFVNGAKETLSLARLYGCDRAILKSKSPSCGLNTYDGTFSGRIVPGHAGVAAALLLKHGIIVEDET